MSVAALTAFIHIGSGFPGWMSPDSMWIWEQATGGVPLNDHHTVWLTLMWSIFASQSGPHFPFIIQQLFFWFAISAVSCQIYVRRPWLGIALPPLVAVLDHSWVLNWLWKDATIAALGLLGVATVFSAEARQSDRRRVWPYLVAMGLFGLMSSVRWYLVFAVIPLAVVIGLRISDQTEGTRLQSWKARCVAAIVFIASFVIPQVAPALLLQEEVERSFASTHILTWDLFRLHCRTGTNSVTPPSILLTPDTGPVCAGFDARSAWSTLLTPDGSYRYRFPADEFEAEIVRRDWAAGAIQAPGLLLLDRAALAARLLRPSDQWVPQAANFSDGPQALNSLASEIGFPPRGLRFYVMARLPHEFASQSGIPLGFLQSGFLYVILLPVFAVHRLLGHRRKNQIESRLSQMLVAALFFPISWTIGLAAVSPWEDTRYVSVAVIWGLVVTSLVFSWERHDLPFGGIRHHQD